MNIKIRGQKISGYYGPETSKGGRWLFVRVKPRGQTYPVARVQDGKIVELDPQPTSRYFTNEEMAEAFVAISQEAK